ncbi:transcription factor NIGTH1 isoform X2 [Brachypodium distachyon]|uniref:HTH myb-type domain-containing protein n=1 Tax=Brachypodium distachyon TaxID=15368 RepID=I1H479_BRADI|nr:transcription factor NIGTH1 isoform X2 [Brachypodium distachyon]KQK21117.1 hypothetical protein BRADI_1g58830v3 [Brachypodium distachyon]|eukprot:XP_003557660.1 transcription factor NIGTH1 isoform X2 [Brachypodium distachyon]
MGLEAGESAMGGDLSLDLQAFAARTVAGRIPAASREDVLRKLEEEKGKIEVFGRELPVCVRLIAAVIDLLKEKVESNGGDHRDEAEGSGDKSSWMSSAQLWIGGGSSKAPEKEGRSSAPEKRALGGGLGFGPFKAVGSGGPAFLPVSLRKEAPLRIPDLPFLSSGSLKINSPAPAAAASASAGLQVAGFGLDAARTAAIAAPQLTLQTQPQPQQVAQQTAQQQQQARKARRCWSPELHRKFVNALNQLGGPHATPKQIRERMQVDGLTNDEVKSHLQKYRLHTSRMVSGGPLMHHRPVVLSGGLWMLPSEESSSLSGSPPGPLSGMAVSSAVSGEDDDGRSQSHGWM